MRTICNHMFGHSNNLSMSLIILVKFLWGESENLFGNLFGDLILDMEDFFWALPIPEGENMFGNLEMKLILMVGVKTGMRNWKNVTLWDLFFGVGFITCLAYFNQITKSLIETN